MSVVKISNNYEGIRVKVHNCVECDCYLPQSDKCSKHKPVGGYCNEGIKTLKIPPKKK